MKNLTDSFRYAPDEAGGGGAATPAAPAAETVVSTPESSPASTPAASAIPDATSGTAASAPAAAAAPSWLESLRGANIPVGKDETETIEILKKAHGQLQGFEQVRPMLPHVQEYLQNVKEYKAWQAEQAKAKQPAAVPAPGQPADPYWKAHWQAPEFNPSWQTQIVSDGKGGWLPAPGAPHDVVQKMQQYQQFQAEKSQEFLKNPFQFMEPMQKHLEQRAQEIAEQTFQRHMQQTQTQQAASEFVAQNSSWLYEIDPTTKAPKTTQVLDPNTGQWRQQEQLSPWGERMAKYATTIRAAQQSRGYEDFNEVKELAYAQVQRDYAIWENQQLRSGAIPITPPATPAVPGQTPPTAQEAANKAFLDKANPAKQPKGKSVPDAEKVVSSKNLRAELLRAFNEGGVTKETLNN